jgi:aminoglycoside phosphotransferase (APT) family kinase protein
MQAKLSGMSEFRLLIDGELIDSDLAMDVINPATEQVIAQCHRASKRQLDMAVTSAKAAFPAWSALPHRDAIKIWQAASGLDIDPDAFRWWQVFSAFKALAIWTLSAQKFHVDLEKRPVLARIGWLLVDRQQRILLDYISPFSKRRGFEYVP